VLDFAAAVDCAQRMVLEHIKPDTILVGHALENDLKALQVRTHALSALLFLHVYFGTSPQSCDFPIAATSYS
jgi:hypothetical protein